MQPHEHIRVVCGCGAVIEQCSCWQPGESQAADMRGTCRVCAGASPLRTVVVDVDSSFGAPSQTVRIRVTPGEYIPVPPPHHDPGDEDRSC